MLTYIRHLIFGKPKWYAAIYGENKKWFAELEAKNNRFRTCNHPYLSLRGGGYLNGRKEEMTTVNWCPTCRSRILTKQGIELNQLQEIK